MRESKRASMVRAPSSSNIPRKQTVSTIGSNGSLERELEQIASQQRLPRE